MNATSAVPSSASAEKKPMSKAEAARGAFIDHIAKHPSAWARLTNMKTAHTFCGCCGTQLLQEGGRVAVHKPSGAFTTRPVMKSREEYQKWVREFYTWDYYSRSYINSYGSEEAGKKAFERWISDLSFHYDVNHAAVSAGIGLSIEETANLLYTPEHSLYGKVAGIELNDKDDGKVSIIWTNV